MSDTSEALGALFGILAIVAFVGVLYNVAGSLGSEDDARVAALETQRDAEVVACEDTQCVKYTLEHYDSRIDDVSGWLVLTYIACFLFTIIGVFAVLGLGSYILDRF